MSYSSYSRLLDADSDTHMLLTENIPDDNKRSAEGETGEQQQHKRQKNQHKQNNTISLELQQLECHSSNTASLHQSTKPMHHNQLNHLLIHLYNTQQINQVLCVVNSISLAVHDRSIKNLIESAKCVNGKEMPLPQAIDALSGWLIDKRFF